MDEGGRLDRAPLPIISNPLPSKSENDHDHSSDDEHPPELRSKRHRSVVKLKQVLHIEKSSSHNDDNALPVLANIQSSVQAEPPSSRLDHEPPHHESKLHDLIHNPLQTAKTVVRAQAADKFASNLLATEIPHAHDVRLVESEDAVLNAKTSREKLKATDRRDGLVQARQKEFIHWTLDRHVTKVKVVSSEGVNWPRREDFQVVDQERRARMDWEGYLTQLIQYYAQKHGSRYICYGSYPPPTSERVITATIERILVVSDPLQKLMMRIRRLYRWDDPANTAMALVSFLLLWYLDCLLAGMFLGLIATMIRRRSDHPNIEDLRQEIERIESMSRRSNSFIDFVEKRGSENWLKPLVEAIGPGSLVQMGDLANLLEVVQNFSEWRSQRYTTITMLILGALTLITFLTPTWLLVKSTTLSLGLMFFVFFPISSHYPNYRLLVSPRTWLLWNIPTHAEWAISTIRDQASREKRPTTAEWARYSCVHKRHKGHLVLSKTGVRFESLIRSEEHWSLLYSEILRMEKVTRITHAGSGKDLKFSTEDGREFEARDLDERDEAFSQILGYTDVRWLVEW